jgi:hypothetical protein
MFNFTAKDADIPLEVGIVKVTVKDVEARTVQSKESDNFGKDMMVCHVELEDKNGNKKKMQEFFILDDAYIKKLGFLCQSIGAYDKYLTGNLDKKDLIGKSGKCEIEKVEKTIDGNDVKVVVIKKYIKKK